MDKIISWTTSIGWFLGIGFIMFVIIRYCGVGYLIAQYIPCCSCLTTCNPFSCFTKNAKQTTPDLELGHQAFSNPPSMSSPITIVNVPVPSQRSNPEFIVPSAPFIGNQREERIHPDNLRRAHREAATLLNWDRGTRSYERDSHVRIRQPRRRRDDVILKVP